MGDEGVGVPLLRCCEVGAEEQVLWEAEADGLYCWDYDRGRPLSQDKMHACEAHTYIKGR